MALGIHGAPLRSVPYGIEKVHEKVVAFAEKNRRKASLAEDHAQQKIHHHADGNDGNEHPNRIIGGKIPPDRSGKRMSGHSTALRKHTSRPFFPADAWGVATHNYILVYHIFRTIARLFRQKSLSAPDMDAVCEKLVG